MHTGDAVEVEIAAFPGERITGNLSFVSVTVNPDTRTVRVRMDLPNPDRRFKPAMLATVLVKGPPQKRRVVPAGAVVREENRDHVFVQHGPNQFVLRQVTLGGEYEGYRSVISGLAADERIVADGAFHLNNERRRRELQGQT